LLVALSAEEPRAVGTSQAMTLSWESMMKKERANIRRIIEREGVYKAVVAI
jgi:hypothetical protein